MPGDINTPDTDSPATMAKHYRTLQSLSKKNNPNHASVSQLLDLEFAARRAFIGSDSFREEDRHNKILEAYPCFKDIGHVSNYWLSIIQNMAPHKTMSCMSISSSYLMQSNVFICILDRWWRSFNAFWTKITSTTLMSWREDGTTSARRCSFLVCGKSCWNPQ